jgi:hypothetical protein
MGKIVLVQNMKAHNPVPVSINLRFEEVGKDEGKGRRRTCERGCFNAQDTTPKYQSQINRAPEN